MQLTDQQKEFYASMESTFETAGWSLLTKGWKEEQDGLANTMLFNAKSMDDINATRVRFALLNELIELPTLLEQQRKAIIENDE